MKGNSFSSRVNVYPSPTQGKLLVTLDRAETVTVVLKNVLGQVLEAKTVNNSKQVELNINNSAGVYFLEITSENNQRSMLRVVKE